MAILPGPRQHADVFVEVASEAHGDQGLARRGGGRRAVGIVIGRRVQRREGRHGRRGA